MCSGVRREREVTYIVRDTSFLQFLFRLSYICKLGISIDDTGYCIVTYVASVSSNCFNSGNTFFFGLVGKHWTADTITNRIYRWYRSIEARIYLNPAKFIGLNT